MALSIKIETVAHGKQRYDTEGDWFYEPDGVLHIRVSDKGDWREEFVIAVHELVESALCRVGNVSQKQVDDWDFQSDWGQPGDQPGAPYRSEHLIAGSIENLLLPFLGLPWKRPDSISSASKETEPASPSD